MSPTQKPGSSPKPTYREKIGTNHQDLYKDLSDKVVNGELSIMIPTLPDSNSLEGGDLDLLDLITNCNNAIGLTIVVDKNFQKKLSRLEEKLKAKADEQKKAGLDEDSRATKGSEKAIRVFKARSSDVVRVIEIDPKKLKSIEEHKNLRPTKLDRDLRALFGGKAIISPEVLNLEERDQEIISKNFCIISGKEKEGVDKVMLALKGYNEHYETHNPLIVSENFIRIVRSIKSGLGLFSNSKEKELINSFLKKKNVLMIQDDSVRRLELTTGNTLESDNFEEFSKILTAIRKYQGTSISIDSKMKDGDSRIFSPTMLKAILETADANDTIKKIHPDISFLKHCSQITSDDNKAQDHAISSLKRTIRRCGGKISRVENKEAPMLTDVSIIDEIEKANLSRRQGAEESDSSPSNQYNASRGSSGGGGYDGGGGGDQAEVAMIATATCIGCCIGGPVLSLLCCAATSACVAMGHSM